MALMFPYPGTAGVSTGTPGSLNPIHYRHVSTSFAGTVSVNPAAAGKVDAIGHLNPLKGLVDTLLVSSSLPFLHRAMITDVCERAGEINAADGDGSSAAAEIIVDTIINNIS
jgi:hypothetical protein